MSCNDDKPISKGTRRNETALWRHMDKPATNGTFHVDIRDGGVEFSLLHQELWVIPSLQSRRSTLSIRMRWQTVVRIVGIVAMSTQRMRQILTFPQYSTCTFTILDVVVLNPRLMTRANILSTRKARNPVSSGQRQARRGAAKRYR